MKSVVLTVNIFCAFVYIGDPVKSFRWEDNGFGISQSTGCDFPGIPFKTIQNSNLTDCKKSCRYEQDCTNFVFIQNETCFLKSCPVSEEVAQVSSYGPSTFCGYLFIAWTNISRSEAWAMDCDFPTTAFKRLPGAGLECSLICRQNKPCNQYTYTRLKGEGGMCLLKTGNNSRSSAIRLIPDSLGIGSLCGYIQENISANSHPFTITNARSSITVTHNQDQSNPDTVKPFEWEKRAIGIRQSTGCDFLGKPFQIRQKSNPHDCETSCQHTQDCSSYVWFQNRTCFLKSGPASEDMAKVSSHDPNTVCGYLFIAWNHTSQSEAWAPDCDFPTETFKRIPASGKECGPLCWRNAPCNHFTFTNFTGEGGMCLLKTGNNSRTLAIRRTPDELGKGSFCGFNQENIVVNDQQLTTTVEQQYTTTDALTIVNPIQDQCDCECP